MAIWKHKRTGALKEAAYAPSPSYDWTEVRTGSTVRSSDGVGDFVTGLVVGAVLNDIFDGGSSGDSDGGGGGFGGGGASGEW